MSLNRTMDEGKNRVISGIRSIVRSVFYYPLLNAATNPTVHFLVLDHPWHRQYYYYYYEVLSGLSWPRRPTPSSPRARPSLALSTHLHQGR